MARPEVLHRESYYTTDLFNWLRDYRREAKGHRPFLMLVVDGPLRSDRLKNLFGSHEAAEGLAIVTTHDSGQYVRDRIRYLGYYLVRYSLSFLAPDISTHQDEARKDCFFHKKMYKPDIQHSLRTGGLCDPCRDKLQPYWTPGIKRAIETMADHIAQLAPYALVMKGGGVKGLAFAGAAETLSQHFSFDTFAGTSAGAIGAALFAGGLSPSDLRAQLRKLDFGRFRDAGALRRVWNFVVHRGLYPGNTIRQWIDERLKENLGDVTDIKMKDLPQRAVVYACSKTGLLTFDSHGERREEFVSFAVRCSMSIPYYFVAPTVGGERVFDGGLRENFPLSEFLQKNAGKPTIGLYLTPRRLRKRTLVLADIADAVVAGDESEVIREHREKIVAIDASPIRTTDFDLSDNDKDFLVAVGRAAALRFLFARDVDGGPDESAVLDAEQQAEALRSEVRSAIGGG